MIINSHSTFGHKTITTRPDDTTGLKIQSQYDKNPQNTKYSKTRCSTCVVCYMVVSLLLHLPLILHAE